MPDLTTAFVWLFGSSTLVLAAAAWANSFLKNDLRADIGKRERECLRLERALAVAQAAHADLKQKYDILIDEPAARERQYQMEVRQQEHLVKLAELDQRLLDAAQKREASQLFKSIKYEAGKARFAKLINDYRLDVELADAAADRNREPPAEDPVRQTMRDVAALVALAEERQADGKTDPRIAAMSENAHGLLRSLSALNGGSR